MENSIQNFAESLVDLSQSEDQQSHFNLQAVNTPGPGDETGEEEGEEESESEGEGEAEGDGEDQSKGGNGDNPPLDPAIVHSPVTTQSGGRPR